MHFNDISLIIRFKSIACQLMHVQFQLGSRNEPEVVDTPSSQSSSQQNTSRLNHISLKRTLFWDSMDEVCPVPNDPHGPRKLTKSTPNEHKNQGNQGFYTPVLGQAEYWLDPTTQSSCNDRKHHHLRWCPCAAWCVLRMCAVDLPNPPPPTETNDFVC